MPRSESLAGLNQALAAIDVMLRNGKGNQGRLLEMARQARQNAERLVAASERLREDRARRPDTDHRVTPAN